METGGGFNEIYIRHLTPAIVVQYLQFKKEYEKKNYLDIWNDTVPRLFGAEELCSFVDTLREKRIDIYNTDNTRKGKKNSEIFNDFFDDLVSKKIKNKQIHYEEFKQLIGSLMSVYRSPKFKKYTENYTKDIVYVLDQMKQEKKEKEELKQHKENSKQEKNTMIQKEQEKKIYATSVINEELLSIYLDLQSDFCDKNYRGYEISKEEKEDIFLEAWEIFKQRNTQIPKKELNTLYDMFYQNNIW